MSGYWHFWREKLGFVSASGRSQHAELTSKFVRQYVDRCMPAELHHKVCVSDIVQSVMLLVVRNGKNFRGRTEEEYHGWLAKISERKMIDMGRRYRTRICPTKRRCEFDQCDDDCIDSRCPDDWILHTEEHQRLRQCIERLEEPLRKVVVGRYLRDETFDHVAAQLDIPTTTCRRRWLKALRQLARLMAEDPPHGPS